MLRNKQVAIWLRGIGHGAVVPVPQRTRMMAMKKRVLIAAFLVAASPAAAQVSTSSNQQGLSPGQTGELAPTQAAPTTGVSCVEEMTATFCNAPTGPNTGGYGGGAGGSGAARLWIGERARRWRQRRRQCVVAPALPWRTAV
jgi:hypothetical protein